MSMGFFDATVDLGRSWTAENSSGIPGKAQIWTTRNRRNISETFWHDPLAPYP